MVFDTFTFFNELDLLEIRLNILDPFVDYFVLCESTQTFSGKPKPLYYEENKARFEKWNHKIIHLVAPEQHGDVTSFERAGSQKDYIRLSLDLQDDDVIYFGDVDEIWTPQKPDKVYNLKQLNYCYYLNQRSNEIWIGTIVGRWEDIKERSFNYWRATHTNVVEGGWHFTNMGGVEQILKKLEAYDHVEYDTDDVKSQLVERVESGEDYVGRGENYWGKPFKTWIDETELPKYIIDNKTKWKRLFQ